MMIIVDDEVEQGNELVCQALGYDAVLYLPSLSQPMTGSKFASNRSECLRILRWICALSSISPACKCVSKVETKHIEPWVFVRSGGKSKSGKNDHGILVRIVKC